MRYRRVYGKGCRWPTLLSMSLATQGCSSILLGMWIPCSCCVDFVHTLDILAWFCHVNAEAACTQLRLNLVRMYALHPHVHCFVLKI